MAKTVLVPLADGFEELEAITIIDLLRRAGFEVATAGLHDGPIQASRGTRHLADITIDEAVNRDFDLVALPGGLPGADHLRDDPRVQQILRRQNEKGGEIAAICAAPKALIAAGVTEGHQITGYPGALDDSPGDYVYTGSPVQVDGNIVTSRGPGTAMDFALTLIETLGGKALRDQVEAELVREPVS